MQLILDADDIDIKGNMSIEQESLNEKFLTNKIIDHLADDITSGNKENIQKQDNIIPDLSENDSTDTDKEIVTSSNVILTNDLNEDTLNESINEAECSEKLKEIISEIDSCNSETVRDKPIDENIEKSTEESQEKDSVILEKEQNVDDNLELEKEIETNIIPQEHNPALEECSIVKEDSDIELINKGNEEIHVEDASVKVTIEEREEKEVDVAKDADLKFTTKEREIDVDEDDCIKVTTEEKDIDLDEDVSVKVTSEEEKEKEVGISEDHAEEVTTVEKDENQVDVVQDVVVKLVTEEREKIEVDVDEHDSVEVTTKENKNNEDKNEDIALRVTPELNAEKQVDLIENDTVEMTTEKIQNHTDVDEAVTDDLIKRTIQTDIPNTEIDDKEEKMECSVIESDQTNSSNESNTPIEIDDEDEKSVQKNNSPNAEVLALEENMEVEELDDALEVQELDDNMEVQELDKNVQVKELDQNTQDKVITIEEVKSPQKDAETVKTVEEEPKRICKLSNNLDIFSDEEEEDSPAVEPPKDDIPPTTEKCINIDDDDDIMLIDEVTSGKHNKEDDSVVDDDTKTSCESIEPVAENAINENLCTESVQVEEAVPSDTVELNETDAPKVVEPEQTAATDVPSSETSEVPLDKPQEAKQIKKPLLPKHFIKTCKKNLADMTRDDLEDFCVLKIVESIVDRSNLGEIKSQLKNLTKTMDECKKKCLLLSKQNKDLQVVLKSVQEEQKNGDVHVTPLKITRSVGLQVVMMVEKNNARKKSVSGVGSVPVAGNNNNGNVKQTKPSHPNTRSNKERNTNNQQIPVPRLVPAVMSTKPNQTVTHNIVPKHLLVNTSIPNGTKNSPPVQKMSEKRPRSQAVTVDLTDDEPPAKLPTMQRGGVNQTMRVSGTPPNVMQPQRFNALNMNSPRKVYIPISGAQAQNVRPGQTIMLKTVSPIAPRQRCPAPHVGKVPQNANQMRMARMQPNRHPAPLPDAMKQYQPPNWKALPPAPDLKLSKVENGIVISWRIDGYQEENHEEIASYQLYAYQETTNTPPTTALWKKIGDVKALPLPMACTLTQFMAGFKYYFAVRAVDVRTRFGPFSLPGSILLLNTM